MSAGDPLVFVPDPRYGNLVICDLHQLAGALEAGAALDDAITDAGIDSVEITPAQVERVRAFNNTGDVDALWHTEEET